MTNKNLSVIGVPAWVLATSGMFSVQLGSALSLPMIREIGAAGTAWMRLTAAAIIFFILVRPRFSAIDRSVFPTLVALGIATGLVTVTFLAAIQRIPLGTAVSIEFLGPLAVATFRRRNRFAILWPFVAFAGVLLMTKPWEGEIDLLGVAYALLAAIGLGSYILLTSRVGSKLPGIYSLAITIPIAAITAGIFGAPNTISVITPALIFTAFWLAALMPVIPYILELQALRGMSSAAFGTLMSLEPAFGTLLGIMILNQHIDLSQFLGITLVVIAGIGSQRNDQLPIAQSQAPDSAP